MKSSSSSRTKNGMIHLNGNLLCAIDIETTGNDPEKDFILQIAIVPLDYKLEPWKEHRPFNVYMMPVVPEEVDPRRCTVSKAKLTESMLHGMDRFEAADQLEAWFERLNLPIEKKVSVLAQNWARDSTFIRNWLGPLMFERIFDPRYRDLMVAALYSNDKADFMGEMCPYPKVSLGFLNSVVGVDNINPHEALSDAYATAETYRRLLMGRI